MLQFPYQKLLIWQKSFLLAEQIFVLTRDFPLEEKYGIIKQMRDAAVSVPSNIAEGSQRKTSRDFSQFLHIARGSLAELETPLLLSKKLKFGNISKIESPLSLLIEVSKMSRSFHAKLTTNH